jgi:hypothetical protein
MRLIGDINSSGIAAFCTTANYLRMHPALIIKKIRRKMVIQPSKRGPPQLYDFRQQQFRFYRATILAI